MIGIKHFPAFAYFSLDGITTCRGCLDTQMWLQARTKRVCIIWEYSGFSSHVEATDEARQHNGWHSTDELHDVTPATVFSLLPPFVGFFEEEHSLNGCHPWCLEQCRTNYGVSLWSVWLKLAVVRMLVPFPFIGFACPWALLIIKSVFPNVNSCIDTDGQNQSGALPYSEICKVVGPQVRDTKRFTLHSG